jgi:hypothetical protein
MMSATPSTMGEPTPRVGVSARSPASTAPAKQGTR